MFKFFLKKNFCDLWDNLFHIFVINLFMLIFVVASFFILSFFRVMGEDTSITAVYIFVGILICSILLSIFAFAEGENAVSIANFDTPKFKDYFRNIGKSVKDGALFGLLITGLAAVSFVSIPYYFRMWIPEDGSEGSWIGLILMSIVFWFMLITLLALQWFVPIRNIMHNNFLKCFKKCYILLFDNLGITILMFINNILLIALSLLLVGFMPGFAGLNITNTNMLRLVLYKYDWIEVNPELTRQQRKEVPWNELLAKDKKTLGPRTFKSFIFPWKQ